MKSRSILVVLSALVVSVLTNSVGAQELGKTWFDEALLDQPTRTIEEQIKLTTKKHAVYSYNLANANTPGFEPILFPEDRAELDEMAPEGTDFFPKVVVELMSAKIAENSRRQQALYGIYRKKFEIMRQVMTMGKK